MFFEPIKAAVFWLVPPWEVEVNIPNVLTFIGIVGLFWFEVRVWGRHR